MAEGFLRGMREIADGIRAETGNARGDRRFEKTFGEISVNLSDEMLALLGKYADIQFAAPLDSAKRAALLDDLDVSFVSQGTDKYDKLDGWVVHRLRYAGFRFCRSHLPVFVPGAKWVSHSVTCTRLGDVFTWWLYFTRDNGETWHTIRQPSDGKYKIEACLESDDPDSDQFWRKLAFLRGATWGRHMSRLAWKIVMQRGSLRFAFHCNDAIAREMLALRDATRGRRTAALHWVADHDRQLPGHRKTHVRAHLRGAQIFTWAEWTCTLSAGLFDHEALAAKRIPEMEITKRSRITIAKD